MPASGDKEDGRFGYRCGSGHGVWVSEIYDAFWYSPLFFAYRIVFLMSFWWASCTKLNWRDVHGLGVKGSKIAGGAAPRTRLAYQELGHG